MATRNDTDAGRPRLLERLMTLELDADETCRVAAEHLADPRYQEQLQAFRADYQRHLRELTPITRQLGGQPPGRPDMRGRLEDGKVLFAQLGGDDGILKAIRHNAEKLAEAYEQALGLEPAAQDVIVRGCTDQRRHVDWLNATIRTIETAPHRGVPPWNIPPPSGF